MKNCAKNSSSNVINNICGVLPQAIELLPTPHHQILLRFRSLHTLTLNPNENLCKEKMSTQFQDAKIDYDHSQ